MTISHEIQKFHTSSNNFAWLCEVKNALAPISPSWSISHDCSKFFHGHAKSILRFSFELQQKKSLLVHFAWICEMEIHNFSTLFCHFFHFFLLNPLQSPPNQLQISVQTNCITSFIMHLDLHQLYLFSSIWFISFVTNLSKSYLKMTPKLHKTC